MRVISVASLILLCACGAPQQSTDGQEPSASTSEVTLRAEPETITPGGSLTLTLENGSGGTVGYNLCASELERRITSGWQPVPENRVCTMELRTLEPGDEVGEEMVLPETPVPGDYRYTTTVERIETRARDAVASNQFRING